MQNSKSFKISDVRSRSSSARLWIGFILTGLTLIVGSTAGRLFLFASTPAQSQLPPNTENSILEIRKGESPAEITRDLAKIGSITDRGSFILVGRLTRQWKHIKAGEYEVSATQSPLEIFKVITSGVSVVHRITVREGENMYEIAKAIEQEKLGISDKFLNLCRDPKFIQSLGLPLPPSGTLEGYLYPETYFFNRSLTLEDMIRQMVRKFQTVWTPEYEARAKALGLNPYQTLTLASVIEKETGAPQERPMVSSVFHNRLKKGMRLQSDPTTIYGIWTRYRGNLHRSDLVEATPWNTYAIPRLPLGPISNPGKESLEAALHPIDSPYLFFVSHNDGTHEFTANLSDHNKAVRKFQIDPKARDGKSWRDLNKKDSGTF